MLMSVWFLAIGLLLGWSIMLLSMDFGLPRFARIAIAVVVSMLASIATDYVAFEANHMKMSLAAAFIGAVFAIAGYEAFASGLERRKPAKKLTP